MRRSAAVVLYLLLLVAFVVGRATAPRPSPENDSAAVVLGPWGYYALREVTSVIVAVPEGADMLQPIHVFVVRLDDGSLIALDGRDPYMRCPMDWNETRGRFVDRCHAYEFTKEGEPVVGPRGAEARPMERFGLTIVSGDDLALDFASDSVASPPTGPRSESGPDEPACETPAG